MISNIMENDALQLAAQPSIIEEAFGMIQGGLPLLNQ
jgi:hypothetical protein